MKNKLILDFEGAKKSCEIWPYSALNLKMLDQRTHVRFMHIFNPESLRDTTKFLGE